ncbi:MAG: hypothetical protein PUA57_02580, partial [Eggerthellales bacterium]|nr:hypothetical protein [Eggerthellales bacterium]
MSEELVAGTLGFDESYDLGNTRSESAKKSIKAVGYNNDLDSFRMYTVYGNEPGRTVRGGRSYNRNSKVALPAADADRAAKVKLELGNEPLVSADARYGYRFVKRAFDILFSAVVLICFSWLYVLIAIPVKVDD